jgi:teichuronic acid biosynthesis glycosyltransferase TuaG
MPLVSVITPVFNAARWLPETLKSVQSQTLNDWEHILVDDGSSDDSCAIIEDAARLDPRIRLLRMERNGGPAKARNVGIRAASGRYLALLDADDLWLERKLERTVRFLRRNDCAFAYHGFRYLTADGATTGALVLGPDRLDIRALHIRRGTGDCMSIVIDRDKVKDFRFPDLGRLHEDWAAWLSLVQRGHVGRLLAEDLGRYRLSPVSRNASKLSAARDVWRLYRSIEGLSWPRAATWWTQYAWNSFWLHRRAKPGRHKTAKLFLIRPNSEQKAETVQAGVHETQRHVVSKVISLHK